MKEKRILLTQRLLFLLLISILIIEGRNSFAADDHNFILLDKWKPCKNNNEWLHTFKIAFKKLKFV